MSGEAEGGEIPLGPPEAGGGQMRIQWMGGNKNRPGNPRTVQTSGATDGLLICLPIFSRFAPVCRWGRDAGRQKFWQPPAATKSARKIGRSSQPTRPIATAPNENPASARASPPAAIWMFARTRRKISLHNGLSNYFCSFAPATSAAHSAKSCWNAALVFNSRTMARPRTRPA